MNWRTANNRRRARERRLREGFWAHKGEITLWLHVRLKRESTVLRGLLGEKP